MTTTAELREAAHDVVSLYEDEDMATLMNWAADELDKRGAAQAAIQEAVEGEREEGIARLRQLKLSDPDSGMGVFKNSCIDACIDAIRARGGK